MWIVLDYWQLFIIKRKTIDMLYFIIYYLNIPWWGIVWGILYKLINIILHKAVCFRAQHIADGNVIIFPD